jgi:hypothetical protein
MEAHRLGAAGTGAACEYSAHPQMEKLKADYWGIVLFVNRIQRVAKKKERKKRGYL